MKTYAWMQISLGIILAVSLVALTGYASLLFPATSVAVNTLAFVFTTTTEPTPTVGLSTVHLPDGSLLVIQAGSEVLLERIVTEDGSVAEDGIRLKEGEVLVKSTLSSGKWFTVLSPEGYLARVSGSIMIVAYDPVSNEFNPEVHPGHLPTGAG
jgi:hypothetical protein